MTISIHRKDRAIIFSNVKNLNWDDDIAEFDYGKPNVRHAKIPKVIHVSIINSLMGNRPMGQMTKRLPFWKGDN